VSGIADTKTERRRSAQPRHASRHAIRFAVLAVALVSAAAAVWLFTGGEAPAREEEVRAGVTEVTASTREAPFPRTDASRFDAGTPTVRVYLRVEDVPVDERMVATVERTGRVSAFSALFGRTGVRAEDGGEGRLSVSEEGASGVVSFAVRADDGGALPAGGYAVEVWFGGGGDGGEGRLAARKYFAIGDPQD
jgi:hypothetical protein